VIKKIISVRRCFRYV